MSYNYRIEDVIGLRLPKHLQDLTEKIGCRVGKKVIFKKVPSLPGGARRHADFPNGIPTIKLVEVAEDVVAEELLHLDLGTRKFPRLALSDPERSAYSGRFKIRVQNLIDHVIIFPQLEDWGYEPRKLWNKKLAESCLRMLNCTASFRCEV